MTISLAKGQLRTTRALLGHSPRVNAAAPASPTDPHRRRPIGCMRVFTREGENLQISQPHTHPYLEVY